MKNVAPLSFAALFGVLSALPALAAPATPSGLVGLTNAERLALGLSPLAPTKRSTAPKVRRSSATVTNTNSTPPVLLIRIANPDGSDLGYISMPSDGNDPNADNGDMVGFDPDFNRALRFGYPGQRGGAGMGSGDDDGLDGLDGQDGPFELSPYDDGTFGMGNALLGVIAETDLLPGTPSFAGIGIAHPGPDGPLNFQVPLDLSVNHLGDDSSLPGGDTLSNALTPITGGSGGNGNGDGDADDLASLGQVGQLLGTGQPCSEAQSKVWNFVPGSKQLLAAYSNSNGETVPTKFVTGGGCDHFICLTADVALFKQAYGMDATEVFLHATVM